MGLYFGNPERIIGTGASQSEAERHAIIEAKKYLKGIPGYAVSFGITDKAIRENIEIISYKVPTNGAANTVRD